MEQEGGGTTVEEGSRFSVGEELLSRVASRRFVVDQSAGRSFFFLSDDQILTCIDAVGSSLKLCRRKKKGEVVCVEQVPFPKATVAYRRFLDPSYLVGRSENREDV